jgi:ribosome-binding factor A
MSWVYDPTLQKNILVHDVTCTQDYDEAPKSPSELKLAAAEANANLQEEVA